MGNAKSKNLELQLYCIRIYSGRHNVTGKGAHPELIVGASSNRRAPKPLRLRPSNNSEDPWCEGMEPLRVMPDGTHLQELRVPSTDDLGSIDFIAFTNRFADGEDVPEDATWQVLRVEIERLMRDGLAIDVSTPGNMVTFPCFGWVEANEVRTFFPASSPVPQLASPDQMAARAIEVEARKAAFQLTTTPGLPASSRFEDFDQLPIDQRPVDARVGMLVELLDEAQVTLLSCGAGHLLDAQGKKWSSLFFGDDREGSVFGELYAMKEEERTFDRAKQIADFCAPNRCKTKQVAKILIGGKVVKLDEGKGAAFMTEEELEKERRKIQEQLERDRARRKEAIDAREAARIAKATGQMPGRAKTSREGAGKKKWLKAAEDAGVKVEAVVEKRLGMGDLATIQMSKLTHQRYLESLAASAHINWFEDDSGPDEPMETVQESEPVEPESLEEFHRFKGSVNPIYMGRMPSRMIGENLANDSKQDWNVEQQAAMAAPFQGAIPFMVRQDRWAVDIEFGRQFVQGCNPHNFRVARTVPWAFRRVPREWLALLVPPGSDLDEEARQGHLLHVDFSPVEEALSDLGEDAIVSLPDKRYACYPQALLYVYNASQRVDNPLRIDEKVAVVPVAIVLELQFDERHRIFTPLDDNFTWLLAKAFVGNADAMYTLGVEWYLKTLLVMEPVAITMFRSLPNAHPVYRFLHPFLKDVVAANAAVREWFTSDDGSGFWDRFCSISLEAFEDLLKFFYKTWALEDAAPDAILAGMKAEDAPTPYPFREDAKLLWDAMAGLVQDFLAIHYPEEESCVDDPELQSWFVDLVNEGIPTKDPDAGEAPHVRTTGFELRSSVARVLMCIIWTTSARNSYLASQLFNYHGHPAVRPLKLHMPPPLARGDKVAEEMLRQALPDVSEEAVIVAAMHLFSKGLTAKCETLIDFKNPLLEDPRELEVMERFSSRLIEVQRSIGNRNTFRPVPYSGLMPSNISVGLGLYKSFDFEGFDADQAAQGPQAGRGQGQGHGEGVAGKSANVSEAVRGLGKTNSRTLMGVEMQKHSRRKLLSATGGSEGMDAGRSTPAARHDDAEPSGAGAADADAGRATATPTPSGREGSDTAAEGRPSTSDADASPAAPEGGSASAQAAPSAAEPRRRFALFGRGKQPSSRAAAKTAPHQMSVGAKRHADTVAAIEAMKG